MTDMTDYSEALLSIQRLHKELHQHLTKRDWPAAETAADDIADWSMRISAFCFKQMEEA
jgi:hypothetical protein